jgi:hypothetical protein
VILNRELRSARIIKGGDSFGKWHLAISSAATPTTACPICGNPIEALLAYTSGPKFPMEIKVAHTILKKSRNPIGVTCGCYAKLIRQVTHIADAGLAKGFPQ